jgi:threonine/homoserine/homoserine lactone efflux protein
LWLGILGPPAAWAAQLLVAYAPVELLCSPGTPDDGVWGLSLNAFGVICTIVAVVFVIACGVVAERARRRLADVPSSPARDRSAFMATLGVISSIYFLLVILFTAIGPIAIPGCR